MCELYEALLWPMMQNVYLRTLGRLALDGSSFKRQKPLLFLAYLALNGSVSRRRLAELVTNNEESGGGEFTQLGAELLYRFGNAEQLYVGGRYNTVNGTLTDDADEYTIDRFNVGAGWFMTKNVLAKVEYMQQTYDGWAAASKFAGAEFSGINVEAVISF